MKIWGRMPADLPPTLQRLIARSQRISLPRSCPAPERRRRLRAALCRQRTVRVTYFALPAEVHAAVQELRTIPLGLSPTDLTTRYGPTGPGRRCSSRRVRSAGCCRSCSADRVGNVAPSRR